MHDDSPLNEIRDFDGQPWSESQSHGMCYPELGDVSGPQGFEVV